MGQAQTCDSAHPYSAASLEHQAADTMAWYPTQSHFPDTEPTSPNNAKHQAKECQVSILNSLVWLDQGSKTNC